MELKLPETNQEGLDAVARAKSIVISNREDYIAADSFCIGLKDLEKKVDAAYDEHISSAFKAHRALVAKKNSFAQPILEARRIIKGKLIEWQESEERKRLEAEAAIRAEAKKRAEDEALARAQEAHDSGDKEHAEEIIAAPVEVPAIVVEKNIPKTSTTVQTRWDFRVVDPTLVPREFLMIDTVKVGQIVRVMKSETRIPGIEAFSKKV